MFAVTLNSVHKLLSRELRGQALQGHSGVYVVDTLGPLVQELVTPANEQGRTQVGVLAEKVQVAAWQSGTLAYTAQGYTATMWRKPPKLTASTYSQAALNPG